MKNKVQLLLTALLGATAISINAQTPTGADYIEALPKANCNISFDVNAEGTPFRVKWGMDTAWDWDFNITRGINFYGKGLFETGRVSFQPIDLISTGGDGTLNLSERQKKRLDWRITLIKRTGTTTINLNCDHEVLFAKVDENGNCVKDGNGNLIEDFTGKNRYAGKPEEWVKLIKATAQYCEKKGLKVISVSPFNESDYTDWHQYTGSETNGMKDFLAICKLLKADEYFKDIRICGGNTLNCDRALPWYNYLKDYLDEGNTHQLAGSFDNYAGFFTQVKADGKVGTADELHNVGEAIVGANYGMTNGIWWGFDSKARGQFMFDSNEGVRIGYGENRSQWTNGAVYRNEKTGEVHGYFGSSERQATNSSIAYISKTKDVFFNGYGPTRMFVYNIPGGTGYQKGQINAERVFDITWGEDVAPGVIDGTYMVMNASSKNMLTWKSTSNVQCTTRTSSGTSQHWHVYPSYKAGDMSYWFIDNVATNSTKVNLNVLNNDLNSGAGVICWDADHDAVEQWYLKYAKNGYYYIISRLSNKYLYCSSTTSGVSLKLMDAPADNATESTLKKYMWRFQPIDSKNDTKAPSAPTLASLKQRNGSVELSWEAPVDNDELTFNILRGEQAKSGSEEAPKTEWNTIGRNVKGTSFVDNTAVAGTAYTYKVIAVDYAGNRSEASNEIGGEVLDTKGLVCQIQFDSNMEDNSANMLNASLYGNITYSSTKKSGAKSAYFEGNAYAMLPYSVADHDELTIAAWVRWDTKGGNWQRVFDFGNDEYQYMFFTPSTGSEMRFVLKNGGDEQILTNGKKLASTAWKHVAVTIKPLGGEKVQAVIYVDGEAVAQSDEFTIKPSDIKPSLCYIGRSMFNADPYYSGRIDDFRVYNYALSAEEIAGIMEDLDAVSKDVIDSYVDVNPTSITTVKKDNEKKGIYDLNGRKINKPANGVYIENGKKKI